MSNLLSFTTHLATLAVWAQNRKPPGLDIPEGFSEVDDAPLRFLIAFIAMVVFAMFATQVKTNKIIKILTVVVAGLGGASAAWWIAGLHPSLRSEHGPSILWAFNSDNLRAVFLNLKTTPLIILVVAYLMLAVSITLILAGGNGWLKLTGVVSLIGTPATVLMLWNFYYALGIWSGLWT